MLRKRNDDNIYMPQNKKRKRGKKMSKNSKKKEQSNFTIDTTDPRFAAMYNDSNYAIDPTDSKFIATENMKKILQKKSGRS